MMRRTRNRNRLLAAATSSAACLAVVVGLQVQTAYAAVSLTVISDDTTQPTHVGESVVISTTVMAGDTPTSGTVRLLFQAKHGLVTGVDNLGYNVDCRTTASGMGMCVTEAPIGAFHVDELAATVLVTKGKGSVGKLTVTATSPADNVSGSDTTTIPIAQ